MVTKPDERPPPNLALTPNTATLSSADLNFLAITALISAFLTPAKSGWIISMDCTEEKTLEWVEAPRIKSTYALLSAEKGVHDDLSNVKSKLSVCHFYLY
jgi:hypothetical protein